MDDLTWWHGDEEGNVGAAVLLALLGAAVGAPAGFITGGMLARILACQGGGGAYGESCGMAGLIFSFLGIPIGALAGAIIGAIVGARRLRAPVAQSVGPGDLLGAADVAGPPVRAETPMTSWLAVAGGLAIALGAFGDWGIEIIPYDELAGFENVLTPGPRRSGSSVVSSCCSEARSGLCDRSGKRRSR